MLLLWSCFAPVGVLEIESSLVFLQCRTASMGELSARTEELGPQDPNATEAQLAAAERRREVVALTLTEVRHDARNGAGNATWGPLAILATSLEQQF